MTNEILELVLREQLEVLNKRMFPIDSHNIHEFLELNCMKFDVLRTDETQFLLCLLNYYKSNALNPMELKIVAAVTGDAKNILFSLCGR